MVVLQVQIEWRSERTVPTPGVEQMEFRENSANSRYRANGGRREQFQLHVQSEWRSEWKANSRYRASVAQREQFQVQVQSEWR